ncbi:uncharacterized protein J7T54_001552 [Emericellopsis cladophorae]|uniref:PLL-like beta propeller domain-containing protein n=1 Tax=Emericellopsis cladophorae TaxID=2686198 RepID=A0A9P9XUC5_9HYPO|nr:uncharacterized protein J7T54_001552 [Emericellopsis cladophorae]KAI6777895.1 hypothetical protein J7T54_001552 [Emericellopsis cladophorae]
MPVSQPYNPHNLPVPANTLVNEDPRSGLQVVGSEDNEFSPIQGPGYAPYTKEHDKSPAAVSGVHGSSADSGEAGTKTAAALSLKPWYRRKKYIAIAAVVILIIVALAVGLGVGLSQAGGDGGGDNSDGDANGENGAGGRQGDPETGSGDDNISCDGGACPTILSAPAMDSTLHLLARSQNASLVLLTRDDESERFDGWTDLGQIPRGNMVAQPVAISWEPNGDTRLDVFALSSNNGTVYTRYRRDKDGQWSDWAAIGDGVGSRIVACRPGSERIDLFALDADSGDIVHNYLVGGSAEAKRKRQLDEDEPDEDEPDEDEPDEDEPDEDEPDEDEPGEDEPGEDEPGEDEPGEDEPGEDEPGENEPGEDENPSPSAQPANPASDNGNQQSWSMTSGSWPAIEPRHASRSAPAVCCRDASTLHDIVYYNTTHVLHTSYSPTTNWTSPHAIAGAFIGDPVLFAPEDDADLFMFFGVQDDRNLYTFTWRARNGGEYTDLVSIGDNVASVPSVVSVEDGIVDVVVLGTDGTLQHQHYDGRSWRSDWEGLNVTAMSAPTVVKFDDKTWIFSVDVEGRLQAASLEADENTPEWRDRLQSQNLDGDLELRYYYNN